MARITLTLEHIRTSAGARFSTYTDDEDRRQQLIAYFNEVHVDGDTASTAEWLADDAELEDVVEAIEEYEDVSTEEISVDVPDLFDPRERDTVLAALRLWQHNLDGHVVINGADHDTPEELMEIARNGDTVEPLTADEIDGLCMRLNT